MVREIVLLGTASQVPTRDRSHHAAFLRWDDEGILLDPGEGAQRQMLLAGLPASAITCICITHLHGDHSLGLPGVVQRLSLDGVRHPVPVHFPASGEPFYDRLRHATSFFDVADVHAAPVHETGVVATGAFGRLEAVRLDHAIETFGYRLVEPDGRRMRPDLLAAAGIGGPRVRELQLAGELDGVGIEEVSEHRAGQRFAFVMDTRPCDGARELAQDADLLVAEATYLHDDVHLAEAHGHLTARQAATLAAEAGVRTLVLTHFSQRYPDLTPFRAEAASVFAGHVVVANDLDRVPVPRRSE
ncbi:ribonuclease Z [Nocardioides sp. C4-1]|uniref:ribonuclease Z n=1 Tax=Nocardioides sp. C4-1 TaxID=3151851 RepID=UPI0032673808